MDADAGDCLLKTPANIRRVQAAQWSRQRARINQLYLVDGFSREQVRDIMDVRYGFNAELVQYKYMLKKWGFRKTLQEHEKDHLRTERSSLRDKGVEVMILLCGREVLDKTLYRNIKVAPADRLTNVPATLDPHPADVRFYALDPEPAKQDKKHRRQHAALHDSDCFQQASAELFHITCNFCAVDFYAFYEDWESEFESHPCLKTLHGIEWYALGLHEKSDCPFCPLRLDKLIDANDSGFSLEYIVFYNRGLLKQVLERTSVIERDSRKAMLIIGFDTAKKSQIIGRVWASPHRTNLRLRSELLADVAAHQRQTSSAAEAGSIHALFGTDMERQLEVPDSNICDQHRKDPSWEGTSSEEIQKQRKSQFQSLIESK